MGWMWDRLGVVKSWFFRFRVFGMVWFVNEMLGGIRDGDFVGFDVFRLAIDKCAYFRQSLIGFVFWNFRWFLKRNCKD